MKNPPAMQETWVPSPGQEDALAEGMATPKGGSGGVGSWKDSPDIGLNTSSVNLRGIS